MKRVLNIFFSNLFLNRIRQYKIRRAWRYQRSNQNPYIEGQTTQWPKKNQQWSAKHTHKTKDRVTRTPLKTGVNSPRLHMYDMWLLSTNLEKTVRTWKKIKYVRWRGKNCSHLKEDKVRTLVSSYKVVLDCRWNTRYLHNRA
jgi:hypothetical protein